MTLEELEKEALELDDEDRMKLAEMLVASVSGGQDSEIVQLWAIEAQRRLEEYEQGLVGDISAEEAIRQVRESLS